MLNGQVALVTGSTSGIGLGIAAALAEVGADVMLIGFGDAAEIERQRSELAERTDVRVLHAGVDMARSHEIATMVRDVERLLGRVDILVNNAGIAGLTVLREG